MNLELAGKVAIVGGASRGLGRACAESLAGEGVSLMLCSRTERDIESTAREISGRYGTDVDAFAGDLGRPGTIDRLVEKTVTRFGCLDILVNNSGGPPLGKAADLGEDQWDEAIRLSLLYFVRIARAAIPHMRRQGGGRIVNILSTSVFQILPNFALSTAMRLAVAGFARHLAEETGRDGILVNNVCPGTILTDRLCANLAARATELAMPLEEIIAERVRGNDLGRVGEPDELASLVTFLVSARASYITGATIRVDGGMGGSIL